MSEVGEELSLEEKVLNEWANHLSDQVSGMDFFSRDPRADYGLRHFTALPGAFIGSAVSKNSFEFLNPEALPLDYISQLHTLPTEAFIIDGITLGYSAGELIDVARNITAILRSEDNKLGEISKYVLENSRLWGIAAGAGSFALTGDLEAAVLGGVLLGGAHSIGKRALKRLQGEEVQGLFSRLSEKPALHAAAVSTIPIFTNHWAFEYSIQMGSTYDPVKLWEFPLYLPFGFLNSMHEKNENYDVPKVLQMPSRLGTLAAITGAALTFAGASPLEGWLLSNAAGASVDLGIRGLRNMYMMHRFYNEKSETKIFRSTKEVIKSNIGLLVDSAKLYYHGARRHTEQAGNMIEKISLNIYNATSGFMSSLARRRRNNVLLNYSYFGPTRNSAFYLEGIRNNSAYGQKKVRTASFADVLRRVTLLDKARDTFWDVYYGCFGSRVHDKLTLASRFASRGNYDKAIRISEQVLSQHPSRPLVELARGYFIYHGKKDQSALSGAIDRMFEDENIRAMFDDKVYGTRNEVRMHSRGIPSLDMIVVRKLSRDRSTLDKEIENIAYYASAIPDNVPNVIGSVKAHTDGTFEMRQLHAGITLFDQLRSLNDSLQDPSNTHQKYELLESAILLLSKCHQHYLNNSTAFLFENPLTSALFKASGDQTVLNIKGGRPAYFTNRVEAVLLANYQKAGISIKGGESILENFSAVNDMLSSEERLVHYLDFNLRNVTVSLDGVLKIDMEGRKLLPDLLEVVNACEFERAFLSETEQENLLGLYYALNYSSGETQDDLVKAYEASKRQGTSVLKSGAFMSALGDDGVSELQARYSAAALQRHLELQGYRARDFASAATMPDKYRHSFYAAYHHNAALSHLDVLRQLSPDELKNDLAKLKNSLVEQNWYLEAKAELP